MWIIAALRHRTFFSLAELNTAIMELLGNLNNRRFKKLQESRRSLFERIERPALKPLPEGRYQYTKIGYARAGLDYHINVDGYLYSVPYEHAKQKLEYRLTTKTLEVFFQGKRIASHHRLWIQGKASTLREHMPSHHMKYQDIYVERTPERVIAWAAQIGESVAVAVDAIMRSKPLRQKLEIEIWGPRSRNLSEVCYCILFIRTLQLLRFSRLVNVVRQYHPHIGLVSDTISFC